MATNIEGDRVNAVIDQADPAVGPDGEPIDQVVDKMPKEVDIAQIDKELMMSINASALDEVPWPAIFAGYRSLYQSRPHG